MTIAITRSDLVIDGQRIIGQVDTNVGGGELVPDEQRRTAADGQPTSEVDFEWAGWTKRVLEISIYLARKVPRALGPYDAVALLHRVARGGGAEPEEHDITGPLASSLEFNLPWVCAGEPSVRDGLNIEVTIRFWELDPEAVTGDAAVIDPTSDEPEPPPAPDPDDSLTPEQQERIAEFEAFN